MINMEISDLDKVVYVEVSGYISSNDAKRFLNEHKESTKSIKKSQYKLIVKPSIFEYEKDNDLKDICMTFFKSGYKKMYLVDPDNYIMDNMSLGKLEQKMFNKAVKTVASIESII
ncbi:MAG: hypothetical protein ACRC3Y_00915 [Romboutsia sp.]|uniref:hypothetical protein n=1 Tax=Romboutsia sp. TaxID=1965302 RepID=UPI003F3BB2A1